MSLAPRNTAVIPESTISRRDRTDDKRLLGPGPSSKIVVITSPPWAKDEPESPLSDNLSLSGPERSLYPSGNSITPVPTIVSEHPSVASVTLDDYNRWKFALPHPRPKTMKRQRSTASSLRRSIQSEKGSPARSQRSQPEVSRPSRTLWSTSCRRVEKLQNSESQIVTEDLPRTSPSETLHLEIPIPSPRLAASNKTPGWDSPWSPRISEGACANERDAGREKGQSTNSNDAVRTTDLDSFTPWDKRRKTLRSFFLHNTYVPLFSRITNITFTTVALALAIRIRIIEQEKHIRGAIGSSPVLAILFAPLTLVHVMVAIYLEYFGRPLGLWRTSAKLAHTLSEVVFICAWSAELALCFDNYFTSPLNCVSRSIIKWYSEFPYSYPLGKNATGDALGDTRFLCDCQRDLIAVVMVALLFYVTNLVISLFRIFEKVKVHRSLGL